MKEESKSWQIFEGKLRTLKEYLQLMDLSLSLGKKQCISKIGEIDIIGIALGGNHESHQQLNSPNAKVDIERTFISARKQLNEQAFVELHCLFSDYISNIISELAHREPSKLLEILSKENSMSFIEIIDLGNYEAVMNEMARKVFRKLENLRSSAEMMDKLIKITKISINQELLDKALLYIEVRHLIIHNDIKVDKTFKQKDTSTIIPLKGNRLALRYEITNKATSTIYELCRKIDKELIKKALIPIRPQLPRIK